MLKLDKGTQSFILCLFCCECCGLMRYIIYLGLLALIKNAPKYTSIDRWTTQINIRAFGHVVC